MKHLTVLLLIFSPLLLKAQSPIKGVIFDSEDKILMPYANIQIKNTNIGTISNENGEFQLNHTNFPCVLIISYIGYNTYELRLDQKPTSTIKITLESSSVLLDEIIIDGEDPGMKIMKEVIARKQKWKQKLTTFKANVYCRTTLYGDSVVALVTESLNSIYWDEKQGFHEIIHAMKQSSESRGDFMSNMSHLPNFYDDNINSAQFKYINIVHPDALKNYDFTLVEKQKSNEKVVFVIDVKPKNKFQPLFYGKVYVSEEEYALLNVDLHTPDYLVYPLPLSDVNFSYKQQFRLYDEQFWLPVSLIRTGKGTIKIPGLKMKMDFRDVYDIKKYELNTPIDSTIFTSNEKLKIDTANLGHSPEINDSLRVPLTEKEKSAFQNVDSSYFYIEAMNPKGFLSKLFIKSIKEETDSTDVISRNKKYSFRPKIWFNRVEGFHLGGSNSYKFNDKFSVNLGIAYNTAKKNLSYSALLKYNRLNISVGDIISTTYHSEIYTKLFTSLSQLLGSVDYYNYYRTQFISAGYNYTIKEKLKFKLLLKSAKHSSVAKNTNYSFVSNHNYRENPAINEGWLNSVNLKVQFGEDFKPFSQKGQKRVLFSVEHSNKDLFFSNFDFAQYKANFDWRINTFYPRRAMQNYLDLKITAGAHQGTLPIQKKGVIDVSLVYFNNFGGFKTLQKIPFEGTNYLSFHFDHSFRSIPLEIIGLRKLAKKGIEFTLHGGLGKTWISENYVDDSYNQIRKNDYHFELGVSINKLFRILRINFTQDLSTKEFFFTFSIPQFI